MSKKITIYVEDEVAAFLEAESERTNVSVSELVRRAIDWYFKLRGRLKRIRGRRRVLGLEIHLSIWRRRVAGRRAGVAFDPHD